MKRKLGLLLLVLVLICVLIWLVRRGDEPGAFALQWRVPSSGEAFSAALQQTTGSPMRPGHKVTLLENGRIFDGLVEAIHGARQSIDIEMYIWTKGNASQRILAAIEKRPPGAKCRVLLDALGSVSRGDEVDQGLRAARCEFALFRPDKAPFARNHRKVAVIDGRIGFTGGFGIDDRWLGEAEDEDHWRDTSVRVEGPAVSDMQEAFAEDWQESGGGPLPPEDFPEQPQAGPLRAAFVRSFANPVVTRAERLTQLFIAAAHQRLWIENAYFVPGKPVLELLARRASEGVDVRLIVPGRKSDSIISFLWQQREYGALQKSGVRVWEFQPTMLHSKTAVVDDSLVLIGSVNLDPLSLDKLEDASLVVEDPKLAGQMRAAFERDQGRSKEQK